MKIKIIGQGRIAAPNTSVTLTAQVTGNHGPFYVRWYLNGQLLPGGATGTLTANAAGVYSASAHDGAGADAYCDDGFVIHG